MLLTDIHVRAFIGASIKTYIHSIAKLRSDVFREYPYLAEPDLIRETNILRRIASSKESVGVLVFDNTTIVGASFGMPLAILDELKKPFLDKHLNLDSYYFFSESVLLKHYRNRGIGHHFFDVREAHVVHLKKYQHICFCTPVRPENDPLRPESDFPLNDFWRKRGYIPHPELKCQLAWKEIGQAKPTDKWMTFWIKDLH
ncbi:MAG: hypothetical protein K2P51_02765 [Rhabdochlamydiaceae bacterium]|nr:hypothetical protein [Rhabdochlamydiaceae bacterium]